MAPSHPPSILASGLQAMRGKGEILALPDALPVISCLFNATVLLKNLGRGDLLHTPRPGRIEACSKIPMHAQKGRALSAEPEGRLVAIALLPSPAPCCDFGL